MKHITLALILLGIATPGLAVLNNTRPPGYGGYAPPPVKPEVAKSMADDSSGLRQGTLDSVNIRNGTFRVFGQALKFDADRVRVFGRDGKTASVHSLKVGTHVRFTLDPTDPVHRRVAVIYVD